jgi:hypothetical protein
MEKELLVLDGEDLVDKEIDVIDEDCFVYCPPISKTKGHPSKNE